MVMSQQDGGTQDSCEEHLVLFMRTKQDFLWVAGQYFDLELNEPKIFLKKVKKSVAQVDNLV
jgi:hypothetical protein